MDELQRLADRFESVGRFCARWPIGYSVAHGGARRSPGAAALKTLGFEAAEMIERE